MASTPRSRLGRARVACGAVLLGVLAVPVVLSHAQAPGGCRTPSAMRRINSTWTEVKAPVFSAGPATISAYAVAPWNPDLLYVTNGKSVMRSDNGGCDWLSILRLTETGSGDVALSSVTTTILSISVPQVRSASNQVFLTAVQAGEGAGRPYVLHSADGTDGSFTIRSTGLPPVGRPLELAIAPSNPNVLYLSLRSVPGLPVGSLPGTPVSPNPTGALYRSTDAGRNWTRASDGSDFDGAPTIEDIAVSSTIPKVVWVVAGGSLRASTDSGATYTEPGALTAARQQQQNYAFTGLDVSGKRVVAFSRSSRAANAVALVSTDGGKTFVERPSPGVVQSTAHTDKRDSMVISTDASDGSADIYRYVTSGGKPARVTPVESTTDWDVQVDRVNNNIFAMSRTAIYKTTVLQTGIKAPPPDLDDRVPGLPPPPGARLTPQEYEFALEAGKTRQVDFTLTLEPSPTPVDLFLLIDNSRSMISLINNVKRNLATVLSELVRSGIDVQAGAAIYQTTEDPPLYQRLARIDDPRNGEIFQALAGMTADANGQDEPVLIALDQAATGRGLEKIQGAPLSVCDITPNENLCGIPKGQNADWNPGTVRILIHATNEHFIDNLDDVPDSQEPSFEEVAATLRSNRIEHIGINAGGSQEARPDLERMSRLVGTKAPVNVDCDQDGIVDVHVGDALVCADSGRLSKMLVDVVKAVRDEQPVQVQVTAPDPVLTGLAVKGLGQAPRQDIEFAKVNVKRPQPLRFTATVSCVNVTPGLHEIVFQAALRGSAIAGSRGKVRVTCGAPLAPAAAVPNQPGNPPPAQAPNPIAAQPAPAIPVPQLQPAPQVQVNPQANPNTGAASQEDEQVQVATAANDIRREEEGVQLAMSALTGVALLGAFGTAHAMRRRGAAPGLARVRTYSPRR